MDEVSRGLRTPISIANSALSPKSGQLRAGVLAGVGFQYTLVLLEFLYA